MHFNGKLLIFSVMMLVAAGPWEGFVRSLRAELDRREMPDEILFLPYALSDLHFQDERAGIWSLSALDAIRYRTDSSDVRFDPDRSTEIALNRLQELFREYGDWARVLAAYSTSPSALSALEAEARLLGIRADSVVACVPVLANLANAMRDYADRPEAAFERIEILSREREAERQLLLQQEAAARQARQDSLKKQQAAQQEKIMYTIRSGDTLGAIALRYRVRVSDLKRWNNLRSDLIRAGHKLIIYRR